MSELRTESISVSVTPQEKRKLEGLADLVGQSLADYVRERLLAESTAEGEAFRFLLDELNRAAGAANQAVVGDTAGSDPGRLIESEQAQRDRIAREVRASFSDKQMEALRQFFAPAFDRGLWLGASPTKKENDK